MQSNISDKGLVKPQRVLISVSDKRDIVSLGKVLNQMGVEIISTGGTQKVLQEAGIPITSITELTKNPEAFGGRMKSLSFQVGSALLYRRGHSKDEVDAAKLGIAPIDLVICNLYPFEQAVQRNEKDLERLIENIDIGGPTLIRAAAKNFASVGVATHPRQYKDIISELERQKGLSLHLRQKLALEAFELTANYDALISEYLHSQIDTTGKIIPPLSHSTHKELRYGENSHQKASLYLSHRPGIAHAQKLQGKELSYNNLLDIEAAWKSAGDVANAIAESEKGVAVSIIKHLNPCGLALHTDPLLALDLAWGGDPVSAFGSIVATNATVDESFAQFFDDKFIEVLVAPDITEQAKKALSSKKNLRLLTHPPYRAEDEITMRSISGGLLVQAEDIGLDSKYDVVTRNKSVAKDMALCHFATMVCKHLKSNAIALVGRISGGIQLLGAGMGQPNRIDSLKELALPRALKKNIAPVDIIMASDAFFPFSDIIEICHQAGINRVIQPGGSIRDEEIIRAADQHDISMMLTKRRHFRH